MLAEDTLIADVSLFFSLQKEHILGNDKPLTKIANEGFISLVPAEDLRVEAFLKRELF